jgi:hypothetical protein
VGPSYHVPVTVEIEPGEVPASVHQAESVRPNIPLRWVSLAEAALLLGVSEVAVRKHLGNGSLNGIRCGRGWRVLLAGDYQVPEPTPPSIHVSQPDGETARLLAQTSESLVALVRDLQRQSLALAGQIGYLQNQLVDAQNQVKLLTERSGATVEHDQPAPSLVEYEAAQRTIVELRRALEETRAGTQVEPDGSPKGRAWRFWRRG